MKIRLFSTVLLALLCAPAVLSAAALEPQRVAQIAQAELEQRGVASASIALIVDDHIAYTQAFGNARLEPARAASRADRYQIGSISKEFLATALLMLQEEGKLSLDDRVGKYLPQLESASDVTLRQLLSHTAGMRDYWPQDYVFRRMLAPVSHQEILQTWARQPLDFPPGERWQYSNTGLFVAGVIFEQVAREPLFDFLQRRVFAPLHMTSVVNADEAAAMGPADAVGYTRAALGPLRPAPHVGRGWLFAAGGLAMTAEDLARWDLSIIDQSLLKPASYHELETETRLNSGVGTRYGLGLFVEQSSERRMLWHDGETSGFISFNTIYPDQRAAIVVLTNCDGADAASGMTAKLRRLVLEQVNPNDRARLDEARAIFEQLRQGRLDRSLLSANAEDYFTLQTVQDIASSIAALGTIQSFDLKNSGTRGGMDYRIYDIKLAKGELGLVTRTLPDGKVEQYLLSAQ